MIAESPTTRKFKQEVATQENMRKIVEIIRDFSKEHGYSPTYGEIALALGWSWNSQGNAQRLVLRLVRAGFLNKGTGARTVTLTKKKWAEDTHIP